MPRRSDIDSILIIGSGPIVIGQACEFDYSGTQACTALRAEGYRIVLVNSNPATIMTDPEYADATYVEPLTPESVLRVIERERPDAVLPTLGYRLDEIPNDITGETLASFEPALDYVVVKVPRWAFEKFPDADPRLGTRMKSVGEVMAIGRTFREALGKALRSLERPGCTLGGDDPVLVAGGGALEGAASLHSLASLAQDPPLRTPSAGLLTELATPTEDRLQRVERALRQGHTVDEVADASGIDPWFVDQIARVAETASRLEDRPLTEVGGEELRVAKRDGLSDRRLAQLLGSTELEVRSARGAAGVRPVFKTVDTCAGEFRARTPYYYSTYESASEIRAAERPRVVILGAGPNRIGQGIEFDYACVHAAFALEDAGYETVMVNCNPETVSTDYDTSGRLYFEPV